MRRFSLCLALVCAPAAAAAQPGDTYGDDYAEYDPAEYDYSAVVDFEVDFGDAEVDWDAPDQDYVWEDGYVLEDGTTVVTSNLSGDWPRGVPIGKIEGLAEADAGWRKSYWLRPMVEVGSVTHVLVGVAPQEDLYGAGPLDSLVTDSELALRSRPARTACRFSGPCWPPPDRSGILCSPCCCWGGATWCR